MVFFPVYALQQIKGRLYRHFVFGRLAAEYNRHTDFFIHHFGTPVVALRCLVLAVTVLQQHKRAGSGAIVMIRR